MSPGRGEGGSTESQPYMTRAQRRRSLRRWNGARRAGARIQDSRLARGLGVTALATVVIGTTTTLATFTDTAVLATDISSGIELAALTSDQAIAVLSSQPGTELAGLSTDELVPGAVMEVPRRIGNNSTGSAIAPTLRVTAEPADESSAELLPHVSAAIVQDEGDERRDITEPHDDPGEDSAALEVTAVPESLAPREGAAQRSGEIYSGGADALAHYTILFTVEDVPELREVSGASWNVSISVEGMSQL
jgi:hypothetical protein